MKATIKKKTYDTDNAKSLGSLYFGEFGQTDGYEEQLFVAEDGQHFIYGIGGSDSPYSEPVIKLLSNKEAESWMKDNCFE